MSRFNAFRFAPKQITGEQQKTQLIALLYQCRPHRLAEFTVEELRRTHGKVSAREVEYLLTIARQNRAGELV